jgi:UDP-glucose 4-epimerase
MPEETAISPEDSYGIAKHAVELELRACREMFGLNYVIFRPHNVFGPRQNLGDRYRNVVGIFMNQVLQGLPMTIFGDGTQTRAFSYIDDVAPMMAEAIDVPASWNETFNIGADQPYSLLQLATAVSAAMGLPSRVTHLEARREVQHAHSTHDKARRVFGSRPQTSLEEGLGRMAAWVRQHGVRTSAAFDAIEIAKNLPASWQTR